MDVFAKTVVPILIEDELRSSYMDYSMSVIIGRALPDVRDGLKPVHRRILYAMHEMGLRSDKKYAKCAGTVGEVLKKFHPHGDSSVYDALVRMAQPWNLRYLLVDGQGNFGSVDGDPAAAYRYTESRMTKLAEELLVDIDQDTVDFSPNFDGVTVEPDVLPCAFPHLLVNGAEGIAVGMATKIPPHNLRETIDGCLAVMDDPDIGVDELMAHVPGPDFPTGGTIYGRAGVRDAYATGRGRVVIRANSHFEEIDGRQAIVFDEIPYQVNKANLLKAIADLVKEKKIEGIHTLRDESDREGMRMVVELKRDAFPEVVLNLLFKHTALQTTFGVILLAIVNQRPRILTLKEMMQQFLAHRREVVLRRSRHQLQKARERLHLVEGFLRAVDLIDEIIARIRASQTVEEARDRIVDLGFTDLQAQAILDMRLQRLTGMERQKLLDEQAELLARVAELEAILGSEAKLLEVVRTELVALRDKYGDARRTQIVDARAELSMHDLVAEEDQIVTISHAGYIKRCRPDEWRMQKRGGFGKKGMATRDEDFVTSLQVANTHDVLLVFTNKGQVFPLQVYEVPEAGRDGKGRPIVNLVPMPDGERVAAVVSVREVGDDDTALLFVTRRGLVKRTPLGAFKNLRAGGMRAASVEDGDDLLAVRRLDGDAHVMLFSRGGKCIRFALDDVPEYGRAAVGNYGMRLDADDEVVDVVLAPVDVLPAPTDAEEADEPAPAEEGAEAGEAAEALAEDAGPLLLTVSANGYGARTSFAVYRLQGRYGKGIVSFGATGKTGPVVGAVVVRSDSQVMLVTDSGRVIRIGAASVPTRRGRGSQGVRLMKLEADERIVDVEPIEEADDTAADEPVVDDVDEGAPEA